MNVYKKKDMCTGCGVCASICPFTCIEMICDKYGFLYPQVDSNRCINCGLCKQHCHTYLKKNEGCPSPKLYSYTINDKTQLLKSSSGGAFYTMASKMIAEGGYVCAAVYDEHWVVRHIISNRLEDITRMQGSKYSQSYLGNCFDEIKTRLNEKKKVLFVGNPCQVLGLKCFLKKNYEDLYLVDFVCHSIPSPIIFAEYIKLLEKEFGKLQNFEFRNKKYGWKNYAVYVKGDKKEGYLHHKGNVYLDAYFDGVYHRECCNSCPVKTRTGYRSDVTIGDFWGYEKIGKNKEYDLNSGISAVIINTKKGAQLFSQEDLIEEDIELFRKKNIKMEQCSSRSEKMETFWCNYETKGLQYAYKKLYEKPISIRIKTFIKEKIFRR